MPEILSRRSGKPSYDVVSFSGHFRFNPGSNGINPRNPPKPDDPDSFPNLNEGLIFNRPHVLNVRGKHDRPPRSSAKRTVSPD